MNDIRSNQRVHNDQLSVQLGSRTPGAAHATINAPVPSVAKHAAMIDQLVEEIGRPVEEVAAVYQCELAHLAAHARILDFLPVLVTKRVRLLYRQRLDMLRRADPCGELLANLRGLT